MNESTGSLGTRLVLATLGFCFVFTLCTVAIRTWAAWQEGLAAMRTELQLVERVYQRTLSREVWEMDRESLQTRVVSAVEVADIGRVVLQITLAGRAPEIIERTRLGWSPSTLAPSRHLALTYAPFPGTVEKLGDLSLYGDERVLWAHLKDEIVAIVVTQIIQSLLLAGLITLLFARSVTIHVQRIARHLAQLTPTNLRNSLSLDRKRPRQDELTMLVSGVNHLQSDLSDYLEEKQRYQRELVEHRDRLADLVRERTVELEELSVMQQCALTMSNRLINASYDEFEEFQQACLCEVAKRLGASHALWYVPDAALDKYHLFLAWQADDRQTPEAHGHEWPNLVAILKQNQSATFTSCVALTDAIAANESTPFTALGLEACAFALLDREREQFGFLVFGNQREVPEWRPNEQVLLAMAAQMLLQSARHKAQLTEIIETQRALRRANVQLEGLSRSDALTGIPNRRHFDEVKEAEFRRSIRSGLPLSLLVFDIDYFKNYNDTYGHAMGDQCLRAVATAMRAGVGRASDLVARIGGEEFAALLPDTSETSARVLAEKVRHTVFELAIPHADSAAAPCVTISIGGATLDTDAVENFDALFEQADRALYQAKADGRNRVAWTRLVA